MSETTTPTFDPMTMHPMRLTHDAAMQMYADFMELDPTVLRSGRYLHRHDVERSTHDRARRSYAFNYCPAVVDTYVTHLFARPPIREVGDSVHERMLEEFWANCDGRGTAMTDFMRREAVPQQHAFGLVELLVDQPVVGPDAPVTAADEQAAGLRPYVTCVTQQDRLNWALDGRGDYLWLRFAEPMPDDPDCFCDDPTGSPLYRTWSRQAWYLHDDEGRLIDSGPNGLGVVPVTPLYFRASRKQSRWGISALTEIAPINREILNLLSLKQEDFANSFGQMTVPVKREHWKDAAEALQSLGSRRLLLFDPDGGGKPGWLVMDVEHIREKAADAERLRQQIYRIARLTGGVGDLNPSQASGVALYISRLELWALLTTTAAHIEAAETGVAHSVLQHRLGPRYRREDARLRVTYNKEYAMMSPSELLEMADQTVKVFGPVSSQMVRAALKRVAKQLLGDQHPQLAEIFGEIETAPINSPADAARLTEEVAAEAGATS